MVARYTPPEVLRLNNNAAGYGDCQTYGSGATTGCGDAGNGASGEDPSGEGCGLGNLAESTSCSSYGSHAQGCSMGLAALASCVMGSGA